ncbi:hypothetical protein GCM10012280_59120 [Wenjunlia tyrosinilytica]|uniref:Uncharacterized protein n=1 Tax=Wenjunlia tyrosinilytica TaxID=1544741 RepID=A0A918E1W0_9ACTN|nr:hypothetical protein GCM10012280_59120 [Wenjunlia tyrosinilytica]
MAEPRLETPEEKDTRTPARLVALGVSALALGMLTVASWAGLDVRPSGDDWCFLPKVRDHGIGRLVHDFYFAENGRIANAVAVGLYSRAGLLGHRLFPVVTAVGTVAVLFALVSALWRALGLSAPAAVRLAAAATASALFLLAQPNPYQTLLWPASSVSHTVPPVLALAAVAFAVGARRPRYRWCAAAVAFLTGVCLGTLSEETSVVALVSLGAFLPAHRRMLAEGARRYAAVCAGLGVAGLATGLAVLATSPGARARRARLGVHSSAFSPGEQAAAVRDWLRIMVTLASTWQYLAAVAVGLLLGVVTQAAPRVRVRPLLALPAGVFALAALAATLVVRPAFGKWTSLSSRTWNDYLLLLVVVLVGYGALLGMAARRWQRPPTGVTTVRAAVFSAVVAAWCVAGLAPPTFRMAADTAARAARWDRQDARLEAAAARGVRAPTYVPQPIGGLREPFSLPRNRDWAATCVARYYRVPSVSPSDAGDGTNPPGPRRRSGPVNARSTDRGSTAQRVALLTGSEVRTTAKAAEPAVTITAPNTPPQAASEYRP